MAVPAVCARSLLLALVVVGSSWGTQAQGELPEPTFTLNSTFIRTTQRVELSCYVPGLHPEALCHFFPDSVEKAFIENSVCKVTLTGQELLEVGLEFSTDISCKYKMNDNLSRRSNRVKITVIPEGALMPPELSLSRNIMGEEDTVELTCHIPENLIASACTFVVCPHGGATHETNCTLIKTGEQLKMLLRERRPEFELVCAYTVEKRISSNSQSVKLRVPSSRVQPSPLLRPSGTHVPGSHPVQLSCDVPTRAPDALCNFIIPPHTAVGRDRACSISTSGEELLRLGNRAAGGQIPLMCVFAAGDTISHNSYEVLLTVTGDRPAGNWQLIVPVVVAMVTVVTVGGVCCLCATRRKRDSFMLDHRTPDLSSSVTIKPKSTAGDDTQYAVVGEPGEPGDGVDKVIATHEVTQHCLYVMATAQSPNPSLPSTGKHNGLKCISEVTQHCLYVMATAQSPNPSLPSTGKHNGLKCISEDDVTHIYCRVEEPPYSTVQMH